ncbi:hypothetical protein AXE75_03305 [Gardnerella vaginalis]|uniref:hypothetical protein n=1 Tax=Gardnerella vaginalis TaxID=2702 RepID=UPI000E3189B2|nr:hypothetical protein [Gardnerella vaginalis]RFD76347.1 hypothetical protein AXE75_03305 [Gardnerella vaginalis]
MFEHLLNKYKDDLKESKNNKEALEEELIRVRCHYNSFHNVSSGFLISFFLGFLGYIFKFSEIQDIASRYACVVAIFLVILIYQIALINFSNLYYEEMKLVKSKLKEINRAQSMPKKVGIRYCNSNLPHYINFVG